MKPYKIIISSLIIVIGILSTSSCKKKQQQKSTQEVPIVDITTATNQTVPVEDVVTGLLHADVTNNITGLNGAKLDKIYVKVGDRVHKGQLLARLDDSQLAQIKINMQKAKQDYERINQLYQAGAVSKSNWEQAQNGYNIAKVQYQNLAQNTLLTSPINGIVTAKNYDEGNITTVQMPILVVEQVSPLKLNLKIPDTYYRMLKKGLFVSIVADALPGEKFEGVISNVYPTVDPQNQTITIDVRVNNNKQRLRPGMYVKAQITFGKIAAVFVPDVAVLSQLGSGINYVYLYVNGKAIYREVKTGKTVGNNIEIKSGVKKGDKVIITGQSKITNQMTVRVAQ